VCDYLDIKKKFCFQNTEKFESEEVDRVEYLQELQKYRNKVGNQYAQFPDYQRFLKYFLSLIISLFMVS
jgi:hypothetical protein